MKPRFKWDVRANRWRVIPGTRYPVNIYNALQRMYPETEHKQVTIRFPARKMNDASIG